MTVQEQLRASIALADREEAMPSELMKPETTTIVRMPEQGFSREKIELIKRTIAVGASDDELELFLYTAKKTGLDPLARQIYAIKRGGKMTIQTGIDGYRLIADRTGQLAGISDYVFDSEDGKFPQKASVTVKKVVNGNIAEFSATARWTEYAQPQGGMWAKMPYLMLGKCAEALALRKAFPADLSGVYTAEEMAQADTPTAQPVMAMDEYVNHEEAIGSASDMDSLKEAFKSAYVAAQKMRDQAATKSFVDLYEKRKKELA